MNENENKKDLRLNIKAAFLDEITADIPALNYDRDDWDAEFSEMKKAGIEHAVMIRCGNEKLISYPSKVLMKKCGCFEPPEDLPAMFLELAEKHGMKFWFGSYFSGNDWLKETYDVNQESDLMNEVNDEFYERVGKHSSAFGGWYFFSGNFHFCISSCVGLLLSNGKTLSGTDTGTAPFDFSRVSCA